MKISVVRCCKMLPNKWWTELQADTLCPPCHTNHGEPENESRPREYLTSLQHWSTPSTNCFVPIIVFCPLWKCYESSFQRRTSHVFTHPAENARKYQSLLQCCGPRCEGGTTAVPHRAQEEKSNREQSFLLVLCNNAYSTLSFFAPLANGGVFIVYCKIGSIWYCSRSFNLHREHVLLKMFMHDYYQLYCVCLFL